MKPNRKNKNLQKKLSRLANAQLFILMATDPIFELPDCYLDNKIKLSYQPRDYQPRDYQPGDYQPLDLTNYLNLDPPKQIKLKYETHF